MSCVLAKLSSKFDQENLGSSDAHAIVEKERRDSELHMDSDLAALRRTCLINNLSDEDLLLLYAGAKTTIHSSNEELANDQHDHKFRLITQGAAEIVACDEQGEEISLGVFCAGDYLHDTKVCGCHSKIKIRALGELRILRFDSAVIDELTTEYPEEAQEFFSSIEQQTAEAGWALKRLDHGFKRINDDNIKPQLGAAALRPELHEAEIANLSHPEAALGSVQTSALSAPFDFEDEILELEMIIDELISEDSFLSRLNMARVVEAPLDQPDKKKAKGPKPLKFWRHKKVWPDAVFPKTGITGKEEDKKSEEAKESLN